MGDEADSDATLDISSMPLTENIAKAIALEVDKVQYGRSAIYSPLLHARRAAQMQQLRLRKWPRRLS